MRYELANSEWAFIWAILPDKPRGVPWLDDRRLLNGGLRACNQVRHGAVCRNVSVPA
jgi:transposase